MTSYGIEPPRFRLPEATRLGPVRLQVADLSRSLAYYEGVLGLRRLEQDEGRASLAPHDSDDPLVLLHEREGVRAVPRRGLLGLYHFAILLPDRAALGRFVAHAGNMRVLSGTADHAVSEAVYLGDPDGLGIEVYADRPRSAWRLAGRELYMTTEPLDAAAVVAAGRGAPWDGMPAGTVMGHVHLHVGDLDRAAGFYHAGLGFDKTVWGYPGALFMSAGGYHHHLGTNTWSQGPPAGPADSRLLAWEVVVPSAADARAAAESIAAEGHQVDEHDGAWTSADPWGTTVRIVASA
jgi:catechol 2,3-dioxygenase